MIRVADTTLSATRVRYGLVYENSSSAIVVRFILSFESVDKLLFFRLPFSCRTTVLSDAMSTVLFM